jgi:lipoyl(octanoyl) transferase
MTVVEPLSHSLRMHDWGLIDYSITFDRMRQFTAERLVHTPDELWVCQHAPVFTQGLAGKTAHVLCPGDIPVLATDRGGQVTFHGPGQVVVYPLIDLRRAGYFVKEYVYRLEESVIRTLMHLGVTGHRVAGAPGIYVVLDDPCGHTRHSGPPNSVDSAQPPAFEGLGKIAALGIKVSRHCTYHGASLNVDMDLEPFTRIHPCGYSGLQTVDLSTIGVSVHPDEVRTLWMAELNRLFAPHHPGT